MNSPAQQIRPSRVWYAVAALVLAAGATVFVILLVSFITGITALPQSMTRVIAPGAFDIKLDKPGDYTIFDEYQSIVGGRVFSNSGRLAGLSCTLTDKATGRNIPIAPASSSATYTTGSFAGRSLFEFTAPAAGVYTLTAEYSGVPAAPQSVLAIGQGFMKDILVSIIKMFVAIGTLVLSLLLSILIFVLTLIRRSQAIRRLQKYTA